ncbi:helix-turn-helix domain-containing protein [Priestia megaterium]|uniref:helix-turn-helix domain-containing protein n=1 Tax=Priestia megaterium TaxID=1404 RepID=UPI0011B7E143|nr:helix-turn-helix domain-containing protein [Priestia megaterium]QDZ88743.1 hypothetical protein D0441_31425 [Priestia megaterium]
MANKRQRKKTMKKLEQLKLIEEDVIPIPTTGLYLGKHEEESKAYQALLDEQYKGTVKPIERFINFRAVILHHCSHCNYEWYAKPSWLLYKANQEHVCGVDTAKLKPNLTKKRLTEADKVEMIKMAEQGMTKYKIANIFGISRNTVISHLNKAGLK